MSLDIVKAVITPFSASNWQEKVILPFLLILIVQVIPVFFRQNLFVIVLAGIFAFLFWAAFTGYLGLYVHNELENQQELLPDWNISRCLKIGLCSYLISLVYAVIFLPLTIIFAVLFASSAHSIISMAVTLIVFIPILFILSMYSSIPFTLFVENFEIVDAFNFSKIIKICKIGVSNYMQYALWSVLIGLVIGIIAGVSSAIFGIFNKHLFEPILTIIVNFAIPVILVNISAQTYKNVINKPEFTE